MVKETTSKLAILWPAFAKAPAGMPGRSLAACRTEARSAKVGRLASTAEYLDVFEERSPGFTTKWTKRVFLKWSLKIILQITTINYIGRYYDSN